MSLLFETIQLQNRKLHNLAYHNQRMHKSRTELLGIDREVSLAELINIPAWVGEGLYRCRVSYQHEIEKVEFFPYKPVHPGRIDLVENCQLEYPYKFEDRSGFRQMLNQNPEADDLIILHNGMLTDATFANVAFYDGSQWLTTDAPLLKGTKRQFLLDSGVLKEASIKAEDLKYFSQLALINAMRDLDIIYKYSFHDNYLLIQGNY
ncbi:aminotransferase class IV [Emticicia sp. TH156]|uniref:aminotransferase class IV n=1 Tax=Emticicia sp. TH156 TaxID=2067454 RepID=UPI000C77743B|nr:aminotransferase class IV [Emticicia sp. TH156]PLK42834.1 hypothetical protein C0V77_18100 [Emticicia sp. TH156]